MVFSIKAVNTQHHSYCCNFADLRGIVRLLGRTQKIAELFQIVGPDQINTCGLELMP